MPDKWGFNELSIHGTPKVSCIENGCNVILQDRWVWTVDKRRDHYFMHHAIKENEIPANEDGTIISIRQLRMRKIVCRICKNEFESERKRGRPPVFCPACKKGE